MRINKSKKAIKIAQMNVNQSIEVSDLVRSVIAPLTYYTKKARRAETAKYTADELERMRREDPDSVLVAIQGSKIIGFCLSRYDDGLIWLAWFGVDKNYRGLGVGQKLLGALEATVRKRGGHKLWCDCRTTNTESKRLLIAAGFTPTGLLRNHWFGQDFILWDKLVC